MDACDVLIVGGGPAGSSCGWGLRESGLDVVIMDKSRFPRDKVCGGWITPPVLEALRIDPSEYARGRVFQPITGFLTGRLGDRQVETNYGRAVSYGIRRCEFDLHLLERSGARLMEGEPLRELERAGDFWKINGKIRARLVIGAGGHFCPVAKRLGAGTESEPVVVAQEIECAMTEEQQSRCAVRADVPELYFCRDLKGYGWCFRKQDYLNVGLGRLDRRQLARHVSDFIGFLKGSGKIPSDFPDSCRGHAYLLYRSAPRPLVGEGHLLIGDAAGLAYWQSGEGIRPAVESGLMAADAVVAAHGRYSEKFLQRYRNRLESRFGVGEQDSIARILKFIPERILRYAGALLMTSGWFSRRVLLDRWFLHAHEPPLRARTPTLVTEPSASRS